VNAIHERVGDVTKRSHVYELKIRGVASDLVRAEFDDVELWEANGATCFRTGTADPATLYGLIKRIETLGLVLLEVDEIGADEPGGSARHSYRREI
jgi:hypothetical protein